MSLHKEAGSSQPCHQSFRRKCCSATVGRSAFLRAWPCLSNAAHAMLGQATAPSTSLMQLVPAGVPMDETSTAPEGSAILAQLKGVIFYLWTLILAVPLFVTMLIMSPFVLLLDKHR